MTDMPVFGILCCGKDISELSQAVKAEKSIKSARIIAKIRILVFIKIPLSKIDDLFFIILCALVNVKIIHKKY